MERAIVVGAGILGSMHALLLRQAGVEVIHLEADAAPVGASVRNFGLIWVSGRRSGPELAAAMKARARWEEIATRIPDVGFRAEGSLTIAMVDAERKVMEEFAGLPEAGDRGITFVEPDEVRRLNQAAAGEVLGALWCAQDAIVEPRRAVGAIRRHLEEGGGYEFHASRRAVDAGTGFVVDHLGARWEGDLVVLALGATHNGLFGEYLSQAPLRRVRLQMLQTAPFDRRLTTSLADADSLRYYPAYEVATLDALPPQSGVAAEHHLQLLVVQRADGSLTIGDTHNYDEPFAFDLDESPSDELIARTERILGGPLPPAARRWEGVYSQCTDDRLWHRAEVASGVWIVTGPGGQGMTCSPAIAEETLAEIGIR